MYHKRNYPSQDITEDAFSMAKSTFIFLMKINDLLNKKKAKKKQKKEDNNGKLF